MSWDEDSSMAYRVVVNHEEQYSIWRFDKPIPNGWSDAGKSGTKEECLSFINQVWTDMRPLSLRKRSGLACERSATDVRPKENEGNSP
jgi:MbtH protein